jgi:hypothetical protein
VEIAAPIDLLCVNYYVDLAVSEDHGAENGLGYLELEPSGPVTASGWPIAPEQLR